MSSLDNEDGYFIQGAEGVRWLVENLPEPFGGVESGNIKYAMLIDRNDPEERKALAEAIRSLKR